MRSIKGIIIGFLLILLGFAAAQYSLIAAGILSAGGLAAVVVSALPKRAEKQEPQAAPAAPVPAPAELSAPELLPDILTDPPVQPKMPPLPQPEAEALYKTLADAYTRIDALSCRGPAWMLERDIRLCKAFCARWDSAKADAQTAAILREKARFVEYSNEFLLPGFGRHGRIPSRRTSGDLLEDLSAAVLKQAAQQQAALEAALRGQKWFEGVKKQLRPIQPGLADAPAPEKRPDYTPPALTQPVGTRAQPILSTDIDTYVAGQYVRSCNIGGETLIWFSDLAPYGAVAFEEDSRTAELTLGDPMQIQLDDLIQRMEDVKEFINVEYQLYPSASGTLFAGSMGGVPHGSSFQLYFVRNNGTKLDIISLLPAYMGGSHSFARYRDIELDDAGTVLTFISPVKETINWATGETKDWGDTLIWSAAPCGPCIPCPRRWPSGPPIMKQRPGRKDFSRPRLPCLTAVYP